MRARSFERGAAAVMLGRAHRLSLSRCLVRCLPLVAFVVLFVTPAAQSALARERTLEARPNGSSTRPAKRSDEALLDASACVGAPGGEELLAALRVEATSSEGIELVVDRSADSLPSVHPASSEEQRPSGLSPDHSWVRIVRCAWDEGRLSVETWEPKAAAPIVRVLDLSQVPSVARARTAAVALLEWAESLLPRGEASGSVSSSPASSRLSVSAASPSPGAPSPNPGQSSDVLTEDAPVGVDASGSSGADALFVPQLGVGFQLTRGPSSVAPRLDLLAEIRLSRSLRAAVGAHGAAFSPRSPYADLRGATVGGELALGYAWGTALEVSMWGVASVDALVVRGTTNTESESNSIVRPLVAADARLVFRHTFGSGFVLGAALDGGGYLRGASVTALGETVVDFVGPRFVSRLLVGFAL